MGDRGIANDRRADGLPVRMREPPGRELWEEGGSPLR